MMDSGSWEETVGTMFTTTLYIKRCTSYIYIFIFDVEGGELEVLQTMSWNIEVDYWVIEFNKTNLEKDRIVSDLLMLQGYVQTK